MTAADSIELSLAPRLFHALCLLKAHTVVLCSGTVGAAKIVLGSQVVGKIPSSIFNRV
jgi:hypothetical protein